MPNDTPVTDPTKVLSTIKKCLGVMEEDTNWDLDILISINTAMAHLNELGCTFVLVDANTLWTALTTDNVLKSLMVSYLWMKTKEVFDPSQSNNANKAMDNLIKELEFRIMVLVD